MTVLIERRNPDTDSLERMAVVDGQRVVDGGDALDDFYFDRAPTEDELLRRFDGPTVFAREVDPGDVGITAGRRNPLDDIGIFEPGKTRLTKEDIIDWYTYTLSEDEVDRTAEARDLSARKFNPALHPRGPDGKFVERPWDIPDGLDVDDLRTTPTVQLLNALNEAGEPVDDVLANEDIKVDGIPDDANSVDEAAKRMGGDMLAFQDVEIGDDLKIVEDNGQLNQGIVEKTVQRDGGPNRIHMRDEISGSPRVVDAPDGVTMERFNDPVSPPLSTDTKNALAAEDVQPGDRVAVVTGYDQDNPSISGVGQASATDFGGSNNAYDIGGETYDLGHSNVAVFDAKPKVLTPDDMSPGDEVAVWGVNGEKKAEGTVDKLNDIPNMGTQVFVDDGEAVGMYPDSTYKYTTPNAVGPAEFNDAAEDADTAGEAITEAGGTAVSDIEDVDPSMIDASMIPDDATITYGTKPEWVGLEEGEWIQYSKDGLPEVGKVIDAAPGGAGAHIVDNGEAEVGLAWIDVAKGEKPKGIVDPAIVDAANGETEVSVPDLSEIGPEAIDTPKSEFGDDDLTKVDSIEDVDSGQFVFYDPGVGPVEFGKVLDDPSENDQIGFRTKDQEVPINKPNADTNPDAQITLVDDEAVNEAADVDAGSAAKTGISHTPADIDPGSLTEFDLHYSDIGPDLNAAESDELQEGDFVKVNDKIGQVKAQSSIIGGFEVQYEEGGSWKSADADFDDVAKVDDDAVVEKGDPLGVDTAGTEPTDAPEPEDNDPTGNANVDIDIDAVDPSHSVTEAGRSKVGILPEDRVETFYDFLDDPNDGPEAMSVDTVTQADYTTGTLGLDFAQMDKHAVRQSIKEFLNRSDGLPDDESGHTSKPGETSGVEAIRGNVDRWKGDSYTKQGQSLERAFHAALDLPGAIRDDGLDGNQPGDGEIAAAALYTAISQEFFRRNWNTFETTERFGIEADDNEMPLYRGVGGHGLGSLGRNFLEEPQADELSVQESKIGNYSTDPNTGDTWASAGLMVKRNATPDDIIMSPDAVTRTGIDTEGEIWLPGGVTSADPSMIGILKDNDTTMADAVGMDPDNPTDKQAQITAKIAEKMYYNDEPLTSESQIDTLQRVADSGAIQGSTAGRVQDLIDDSRDFLEDPESSSYEVSAQGPEVEDTTTAPDVEPAAGD